MPAGPTPWNPDFSDWYSKHRHSKNKKDFKYAVSHPTTPIRSSLTGDVYKMPKQDYTEFVKYFNEHHSELSEGYKDGKPLYRKIETPADYIDYGFSDRQKRNLTTQECKGGHIKRLTYNPLYMLFMVEFSNRGDICVFFNLPANVAAQLMYLAETNTMAPPDKNGKERHMVGVEFWNLVRVRGSLHKTQYPFQYTKDFRTGRAAGRTEGIGPDGKPSKYIYEWGHKDQRYKVNLEENDAGHDVNTDDTAIYRKTPYRIEREAKRKAELALEEEMKRDKYAGEDTKYTYTEKDLSYYFDEGLYNTDIGRRGVNQKKLREAYDTYMSEEYDTPNDIMQMIKDAGGTIFEA